MSTTFTTLKAYLGLTFAELAVQDAALSSELTTELALREVNYDTPEPIGTVPMVRQLIEETRLEEVIGLAGVSEAAQTALRAYVSPEAIDDGVLQLHVSKTEITAAEATSMGRMLERYFVCEDSVELVGALDKDGDNVAMAERSAAYWLDTLSGVTLPDGTKLEAVAEVIARRLEVLYPGAAVRGRIPPVVETVQKAALDALVVLEARNPRRFDGTFADLDVKDAPSEDLPMLQAHWGELMKMVRGCPGLGLEQVFDDLGLTTGQRYAAMAARIGRFIAAITSASGPSSRFDALALDLSRTARPGRGSTSPPSPSP
ncbi:MAG: hypothetical protein IPL61_23065 [Myxococcales bacterium]|nr:hypothetical protein [Myxococcales bacterium]